MRHLSLAAFFTTLNKTWTRKHSLEQQLNVFEMACLGITRRDRLLNDDLKKHLHLQKEVNYRIQ